MSTNETARIVGKTILLTRTQDANSSLARLLNERGAQVVSLPTIEIADPDSWDECDDAISHLARYDAVFFTSRNAVEKFLKRLDLIDTRAKSLLAARPVYAVGEKTEEALESFGLPVAMTPDAYSAEALAASFLDHDLAGKRFLFPKSSLARDILPNALRDLGANVDEIVVYKNVAPSSENLESLRAQLLSREIDVVTFFSPSAVRNFFQMLGKKSVGGTIVAAVGPVTAEAARQLGLAVDIVAKQSTAESLVQAIEEYFQAAA